MDREYLYGLEFDWFALDNNNNIALISSAGFGDIPNAVIQNYEAYNNISEMFSTPHIGTTQIWDDYANYGLFVYDWNNYNGHYEKVKNPQQKISKKLKTRILNIPDITKLSVDFLKSTVIKIV